MDTNINKTLKFLKEKFDNSTYMRENEVFKKYRVEHSIRFANLGKEIARKEGLNEEALVIGCLLHDISYVNEFTSDEDHINHGRSAAKMARQFLKTLSLDDKLVEEICFGIAIHVDNKSDFSGERTVLAETIGDCDNIDRFDVFRIYEGLEYRAFSSLSYDEQMKHVNMTLEKLNKCKDLNFATKTATEMWVERINFQIKFFNKLKYQLESSIHIELDCEIS